MYRLFLFCFCLFAACQKNHSTPLDTTRPVITVSAPADNQVSAVGQEFTVMAQITDDVKIEEVHLEIVNTTSNVLYTHEHFVPGSASYTLSRSFRFDVAAVYKIRIEADDSSGNIEETERTLTVN